VSGSQTLVQYSNALVYASMIAFAAAMVAFAASFAARREPLDIAGEVAQRARVEASGSVATIAPPASPPTEVSTRSATRPGDRAANIGMSLTWLATLLLLGGVLLRGLWAARVPWGNMYEFSLTAALAVSVVYLGISLRSDVRWLGLFIVAPVLLTLGLAVTVLYNDTAQLVPALKSYWLLIHVSAAVISAGAFTVGAAFTTLYLAKSRVENRVAAGESPGRLGPLAQRVPAAARLDTLAYRTYVFVFPLWTFAVVAGAIWAENAWGRYWGWDPKETWAFITWVVYAGYLHARATAGWNGRRAAILALVGYGCFLFNYFGVNIWITGLHSYAGR